MGVNEGNLQVINDVEVVMEKLSNSISLRYILTSSDYGISYICDSKR